MAEEKKSVFMTLNSVNCNEHTEKKNGLTYLSWAWAWAEVKKRYPSAFYTIYETPEGRPYWDDGRTCWVKTGVTIEGLEHIEYLPVMDYKNNSIPVDKVTSFDMNKAIQRSLTKAAARHGLGLYIYAGEDLPEDAEPEKKETAKPKTDTKKEPAKDNASLLPGGSDYLKVIAAFATGKLSKTGEDYRTVWAKMVNATEEMMFAFDRDVTSYRFDHKIEPVF
jgi:hypothetical protein